ncbi:unnamed protein product [Effrenium voratum]|uniref:DUS-like FMN-binding domain-containing protein n=1 Tax=Effrenium voratum TaxID=2562239 RepID=A0AA36HQV3_9DINO|nr:unnamed protein product [Effrenium voratum]
MNRKSVSSRKSKKVTNKENNAKVQVEFSQIDELKSEIREMRLKHGPMHAKTLTLMNDLALALRDIGKSSEAVQLYEEVHHGCKKALGEFHPYTLSSMSNLANMLFELDRLDQAKPLLVETLQRQSQMRGEKHLDTLQTAHNLALLLEEQGPQAPPFVAHARRAMSRNGHARLRALPGGWKSPALVMAPMVKQSDRAFRQLLRRYGCTLCYTEMLMAEDFAAEAAYRRRALGEKIDEEDHPLIVQFAAHDPETLLRAALRAQEMGADGVDINLGCPQRRAREGRYGAWLANDEASWPLISEMVRRCAECEELRIPLCCKIRLQHTLTGTIKFAKLLEDSGCALLAVHGRKLLCTKSKHRDGPADLGAIAAVRAALRIPVLSNGNVRCPGDVVKNLQLTGCEGIMCAEQLLNDPALFSRAEGCEAPGAEELVDEYLGFCADFGAEDEAVCFSIWGASNGHVIREHVHRMRSQRGPGSYAAPPPAGHAEPLYIRAYEGQKSQLGAMNPVVMQTAVNLAGLKQARGHLEEAEALDREALAGCREVLGDENAQTLQSGNCLARLLHEQGMLQEAEELLKEVLQGRLALLGETDPATLTSLNNLGGLYYTWGRWSEAEPHFFAALEGRKAVLGPLHPDTLQSANNLASLFQARGRLDKAKPLFREALEGRRQVFGDLHPETLTSCSNLASLLHLLNQLDEADELMNTALAGRRKVLGELHKDTLTSMNNLAGLLRTQAKHREAERLYEEALAGRKELLGVGHMDTLMTANNYGLCLMQRGEQKEAEATFVEVLRNCRESLGDTHSYTLTCANSLGSLLHEAERFDEAEPIFREVLAGLRTQLGDKHPDTLTGANNLAVLLYSREEYTQAAELFQEVLNGRRAQLGDKHPDTAQAARHLTAAQQAQRHLETPNPGFSFLGCGCCTMASAPVP